MVGRFVGTATTCTMASFEGYIKYIFTYMYIYIYLHIFIYKYICTLYLYGSICIHIVRGRGGGRVYIYIYIYVYIYICVCVCVCIVRGVGGRGYQTFARATSRLLRKGWLALWGNARIVTALSSTGRNNGGCYKSERGLGFDRFRLHNARKSYSIIEGDGSAVSAVSIPRS
jgi:hypothetical protein